VRAIIAVYRKHTPGRQQGAQDHRLWPEQPVRQHPPPRDVLRLAQVRRPRDRHGHKVRRAHRGRVVAGCDPVRLALWQAAIHGLDRREDVQAHPRGQGQLPHPLLPRGARPHRQNPQGQGRGAAVDGGDHGTPVDEQGLRRTREQLPPPPAQRGCGSQRGRARTDRCFWLRTARGPRGHRSRGLQFHQEHVFPRGRTQGETGSAQARADASGRNYYPFQFNDNAYDAF